jgi:hypothetical protein
MKVIAKVPKNTITYECGERLMACEVTDDFKSIVSCDEFFKSMEAAKAFTQKYPEYKWKPKK